jgi:hypothetical protein
MSGPFDLWGVRLHDFELHDIRLPRNVPQWTLSYSTLFCYSLSFVFRFVGQAIGEKFPISYRWIFAELTSAYPDYTAVYVEGSFVHGSTVCTSVYRDLVFLYYIQ